MFKDRKNNAQQNTLLSRYTTNIIYMKDFNVITKYVHLHHPPLPFNPSKRKSQLMAPKIILQRCMTATSEPTIFLLDMDYREMLDIFCSGK